MRSISALPTALLLCLSTPALAAAVKYQHPDLTIVAREEPLESVLSSIAREMQITVRAPPGLNPLISCDIQSQPVTQAFKDLLRGLSYTLEWEEKSQRLMKLTILTGGEGTAVASAAASTSPTARAGPVAPVPVAGRAGQGADRPAMPSSKRAAPSVAPDTAMAEREAQREADRVEHEARMAVEREAMEAQMAEERVVEEERMREEAARVEAEVLDPEP
jgi:hypothetical protein